MDFQIADLFSLLALFTMEVALGIDNVIFVSIIAGKLPQEMQGRVRRTWMVLGLTVRVVLLALLVYLVKALSTPLFNIDLLDFHHEVTGKHLILFAGGLFLLYKAVHEIHEKLEGSDDGPEQVSAAKGFLSVMVQIMVVDLVFSVDSLVTAIGMSNKLWVMVVSVVAAMAIMFVFAKRIGSFVMRHPTFKMLALCFLLLIGVLLVAEGIGQHISKGYVYFAMAFSLAVELLNMRMRAQKAAPVKLHMPNPDAVPASE